MMRELFGSLDSNVDQRGDVMLNQLKWKKRGTFGTTRARLLFAIALLTPLPAGASITGVCPDGSIFIVQSAGAIPCRDAKRVDPIDVPPLKPQFLPRPYGWEVFNRRNDPNNPYNLIRSAPINDPVVSRTQPQQEIQPEERVAARTEFVTESTPAPAPTQAAKAPATPLGLASSEIRDLVTIVDLSQRSAPAALTSDASGGRLQLAMSQAFESRLYQRFEEGGRSTSGNVVLFSADTEQAGSFYGNLTFVQGHVAYQPDSANPFQLGLVHGSMGELDADEPVVGYVVLPEHIDVTQPIDIYWNDLQVTATLTP
jgi:hypothetical protein